MMFSFLLANCSQPAISFKAVEGGLGGNVPGQPDDEFNPILDYDGPVICQNEQFVQDQKVVDMAKLDLLFVIDTSGSMKEDREKVINGISALIDGIVAKGIDPDFNIGVILAHANEPHSGTLYSLDGKKVLKSKEMSIAAMQNALKNSLRNPATEKATSGGEVGLGSLYKMMHSAQFSAAQAEGMFRSDASLAIIFISDENDICAKYPAGVPRIFPDDPGGNNPDNHSEKQAYNNYCVPNKIDQDLVAAKLRDRMQTKSVIVSSVIHTGAYPINGSTGEEEIGYGYKEMAEKFAGKLIDISLVESQMKQELSDLGKQIGERYLLKDVFTLAYQAKPVVKVETKVDGQKVGSKAGNNPNRVFLLDYLGVGGSIIDVEFCFPEKDDFM